MQCEIEALCAENSWLKHERLSDHDSSLQTQTSTDKSDRGYQGEGLSPFIFDSPGNRNLTKTRLLLGAAGLALFLAGLLSGYIAFGKTTVAPSPVKQTDLQTNAPARTIPPAPAVNHSPDADAKKAADTSKSTVPIKKRAAPAAGNFYRVVRSTHVRSAPNASSEPVAEVRPGMAVKVVAIRGEWLQVQSLYGRPPGFIHKDTAVRNTTG
jgi:hypothetical protein